MGGYFCTKDEIDQYAHKKVTPIEKQYEVRKQQSQQEERGVVTVRPSKQEYEVSRMSFKVNSSRRSEFKQSVQFSKLQVLWNNSRLSREDQALVQKLHYLELRERIRTQKSGESEEQSEYTEEKEESRTDDIFISFDRKLHILKNKDLLDPALAPTVRVRGVEYPLWAEEHQLKESVAGQAAYPDQRRSYDYRHIKAEGNIAMCIAALSSYCQQQSVGLIKEMIWPQTQSSLYNLKITINGSKRRLAVPNAGMSKATSLVEKEGWMSILGLGLHKLLGGECQQPGTILYRMCGWIPETITFSEVPRKNLWRKLYDNFREGNIIICIGCWQAKDKEKESRAPKVRREEGKEEEPPLKYILIVKLLEHKEQKFVKCRNFSGTAPALKSLKAEKLSGEYRELLGVQSTEFQTGSFWVDWRVLSEQARTIQLAWPPQIYPYRIVYHSQVRVSPDSQFYNSKFCIKYFPQYVLRIRPHEEDFEVRVFAEGHLEDDFEPRFCMKLFHYSGDRIVYPHESIRSIPYDKALVGDVFIFESSERADCFLLSICPERPCPPTLSFSLFLGSFIEVQVIEMAFRRPVGYSQLRGRFAQHNIGENMYSPEFIKNDYYVLNIERECFLSVELEGPENSSVMAILVPDPTLCGCFEELSYDLIVNGSYSKGFYFQGISSVDHQVDPGQYVLIISVLNKDYGDYSIRLLALSDELTTQCEQPLDLPPIPVRTGLRKDYPFSDTKTASWHHRLTVKGFQASSVLELTFSDLQLFHLVGAPSQKVEFRFLLKSSDYENLYHELYDEDVSQKTIELEPPHMRMAVYRIYKEELGYRGLLIEKTLLTNSSYGIYSRQIGVPFEDRKDKPFAIGVLCLCSQYSEGVYSLSLQSSSRLGFMTLVEQHVDESKTIPNSYRKPKQPIKSFKEKEKD